MASGKVEAGAKEKDDTQDAHGAGVADGGRGVKRMNDERNKPRGMTPLI